MLRQWTQRTMLAATALAVVCVLAGCGGGSSKSAALTRGEKQYENTLKYAKCMRANGISGFPDPTPNLGIPTSVIAKLDPSSPAFGSASKICDKVLPNDGQLTQSEFESIVTHAVKVAECMRAHGIPMPDPEIDGHTTVINMAHVTIVVNAKFNRVGDLCDKKVYGYA